MRNKLILLLLLNFGPALAALHADPIVVFGTTPLDDRVATGIAGFDVDGVDYDIQFVYGDYTDLFSFDGPLFFGDFAGATDAADRIAGLLTSNQVNWVSLPVLSPNLVIVYGVDGNNMVQAADVVHDEANISKWTDGVWPDSTLSLTGDTVYAIITPLPDPVPEPNTFLLCVIGIGFSVFSVKRLRPRPVELR